MVQIVLSSSTKTDRNMLCHVIVHDNKGSIKMLILKKIHRNNHIVDFETLIPSQIFIHVSSRPHTFNNEVDFKPIPLNSRA